MTSIATFGYGLTVRGTGLITAAHAWPALEPTFRFLDLLALRRKNDALFVKGAGWKGKGQIAKIPNEIWVEIRKMIVDEKLETAERELLNKVNINCEAEYCVICEDLQEPTWEKPEEAYSNDSGDYRFEDVTEFAKRYIDGRLNAFEPIHRLLNSFGLAHPLTRFIPLSTSYSLHIDSLAFIALPSRTDVLHRSTISGEYSDEDQDQHTFVDVSLELPPDPDSRFVRFIRLFNLEVVLSSISTLRIVNPPSVGDAENGKKKKKLSKKKDEIAPVDGLCGIKNKVVKEIKPGWKLYTACHVDEA